jgi:hypothetical protein
MSLSCQSVLGLSFRGEYGLLFYLCIYFVEVAFDWCERAFPAGLLDDLGQGRCAGG